MFSEQTHAILAGKSFVGRGDLKSDAVFVQPDFFCTPIIFFAKADADNLRFRPRRDFVRPLAVAVQKQFPIRREQFRKPAFFLRHAGDIAKKFQMLAPDARDDAELRRNHFHQRREFAGMIRAGFQHRRLMRFSQPQQSHRHADVIIKTRLAPQRRKFLAQHGRQQFLHRRLAIRAADRDDRQIKFAPVSRRQLAQRHTNIFYREQCRRWLRRPRRNGSGGAAATFWRRGVAATQSSDSRLFNDDSRDIFHCDFGDKIVAVKLVTLDGKKQIARLRRPRIGADGLDFRVRRAADDFGTAGFGNPFQRARFHNFISAKMSRSPPQ